MLVVLSRSREGIFLHVRPKKGKIRLRGRRTGERTPSRSGPTTRSLPARFLLHDADADAGVAGHSHRKAPFGPVQGCGLGQSIAGRSPAAGGAPCLEDLLFGAGAERSRGWRSGCPSRLPGVGAGEALGAWGVSRWARATRFCGAHGESVSGAARSTSSTRIGRRWPMRTPVLVAGCNARDFGDVVTRSSARRARYAGAGVSILASQQRASRAPLRHRHPRPAPWGPHEVGSNQRPPTIFGSNQNAPTKWGQPEER